MNIQVVAYRATLFATLLCTTGCFTDDSAKLGRVVNDHGEITHEVKDLLELTHVESDGTLTDTIEQTQKHWLRKPGQERWDIEQYVTDNERQIRSIFDSLGMVKALVPQYQEYDYVFILGALFGRIKTRLDYAIELFQQGIRFKKLVFLGGARPVVPKQGENLENYAKVLGLDQINDDEPQTEAEIMKLVYNYAQMPEGMKDIPVEFIDVPMVTTDSGVRRPATEDIINGWLAGNQPSGRCLFISNQPYVGFQDAVVKTYMPDTFTTETVGSAALPSLNIGIILDNVARWLYQEGKRLDSKK